MKFSAVTVVAFLTVSASAAPMLLPRANNTSSSVAASKATTTAAKSTASAAAANKASAAKNGTAAAKVATKNTANQKAAAFFISNELNGNFIVAMDIGTDGQLKLARATSTGGEGAHGAGSNGPDALFSQNSIKVNAAAKMLVTVNAGSNTLSMFSIDPKAPTNLKLVGGPVSSEGEFPIAVAINKKGDTVCVLNSGTVNGVNCYSVDAKTGLHSKKNTLRSLDQKNVSNPPNGPANTPSDLIFSSDDKSLIATIKGDGKKNAGFVAKWDIAGDGSLSQNFQKLTVPNGGSLPFGMTKIPGSTAVLAADAGVGFEVLDFATQKGNVKIAGKSNVVKIGNQQATCWTAHSRQTGNFYLSDIGANTITEVSVDKQTLKGKVVKSYNVDKGSSPTDIRAATINNKDFLYVLAPGKKAVDVFQLNAPGQAKQIQTLDVGTPAQKAGLTLNNNNMQGMAIAVFNN